MKNLFLLMTLILIVSCDQTKSRQAAQEKTPNMEYGGWSGTLDDHSKESLMTRELMKKYTEGNFRDIAYMISDDTEEYYFNDVSVDKEGWLSAAEGHHELFDDIANDKVQPINLTTGKYDNGSVWSMAWFIWTGKGKYTGAEVKIYVHHGFKFEEGKIVAAYHFFDPTLFNRELAAAETSQE